MYAHAEPITGTEVEAAEEPSGFTARSLALAAILVPAVVMFIHYAELFLGGRRGHTALANTSIPVGAFFAVFVVAGVNLAIRQLWPSVALRRQELTLLYVLLAASTVIASSGGVHFLVPTLTAAFYYASPENAWDRFHGDIPAWFSPRDMDVILPFYMGEAAVPWRAWLVPIAVWTGFLLTFYFGTLCICALLRRQWVEREKLTFPTVYVPLYIADQRGRNWRSLPMWIGFALPFAIGTINTLNLNFPTVPHIQVRPIEIATAFSDPPWNAMGGIAISLYPFIIGLAYLLSLEMTFSCVFFYFVTLAERLFGAVSGLNELGGAQAISRFPWEQHQAAGAFIAITLLSLWIARRELAATFRGAFGGEGERWPVWGLIFSFGALVGFCRLAGMSYYAPAILILLAWVYMAAATRIRAETGNAWLFGPRVDPHTLMVTTFGSAVFGQRTLTIMAYLSNISSFDLRCIPMPHQLDGFKLAHEVHLPQRRLAPAMIAALGFALVVGLFGGLFIWYRYGALAELDAWRTSMGRQPFDRLASYLSSPLEADRYGSAAVVGGLAVTALLAVLRTKFVWWPFHPVGYALANTGTMRTMWLPFLVAWLIKSTVLRYGGPGLYRRLLPFFLGLVIGDFVNGGLWTLIGCLYDMRVYPINW